MTTDRHGNQHRGEGPGGGQFAGRERAEAEGTLGPAAERVHRRPLSIAILERRDPEGGFDVALDAPTGRIYLHNGKKHRENGPAYEGIDGEQQWWQDGVLHREDGPAVIHDDGVEETWVRGEPIAI